MAKPILLPVPAGDSGAPSRVALPADPARVMELAAEKARNGTVGAMATVIARQGSAPSTPGQKIYAAGDGSCFGTVGGGAVERSVIDALDTMVRELAAPGGDATVLHALRTFRLGAELGMCCGGSVEFLIEPILALTACLIVGAGHVATATAPLLAKVGFAVTVCDAREDWAVEERIPGVRVLMGDYDEVTADVPRSGAALVMTHDHGLDQAAIEWALREKFAYVGGIGSRAKAQRTRDRLEAKGFSEDDRKRVHMPIGMNIGARLPDEIAVAIGAEMIAWRKSR